MKLFAGVAARLAAYHEFVDHFLNDNQALSRVIAFRFERRKQPGGLDARRTTHRNRMVMTIPNNRRSVAKISRKANKPKFGG